MRGEQLWRKIVSHQKNGVWATLTRFALLPFSWIFRFSVFLRTLAYEKGLFRRYDPPVSKVISVGNIAIGGTGKTPFVLFLASQLSHKATTALLYRGYRSKAEKLSTPLTLCRGKGPMFPAHYCGDEPYLVAQRLPHTHIFVGKNRITAARLAAESGADLILLDDGMQHRGLIRDLDIVILDSKDPLGQGHFIPRGLLREGKHALKRADLVVFHPVEKEEEFEALRERFTSLCSCPMIGTTLQVQAIRTLDGEDVGSLVGQPVGFFCGIAQPERFRQTLKHLGVQIVAEKLLNDHEKIGREELEELAKATRKAGGEALLCTEKDRVKLPENLSLSLPVYWVDVSTVVTSGHKEWETFLEKLTPTSR